MNVFNLPNHVLEKRINSLGHNEWHLRPDLEKWLIENRNSVTLTGCRYPALLIKDEQVAVEFKLIWL